MSPCALLAPRTTAPGPVVIGRGLDSERPARGFLLNPPERCIWPHLKQLSLNAAKRVGANGETPVAPGVDGTREGPLGVAASKRQRCLTACGEMVPGNVVVVQGDVARADDRQLGWLRHVAQLLEHAQRIPDIPDVGDFAVHDAHHHHTRPRGVLARGRDAQERSLLGPAGGDPDRDAIPLRKQVIDGDMMVRKRRAQLAHGEVEARPTRRLAG